jgi:hypothetical protein
MFGKLQLYAFAALAFVAAILGVYIQGGQAARNKAKTKELQSRLDAVKAKQKVTDDVKSADDDELIAGITRKLR